MKKLNNYVSPEIIIVELESEDVITTSYGDTEVGEW